MNITELKGYYEGYLYHACQAARHVISAEIMASYYLDIAEKIGMLKARLAICNPNLNIWQAAGLGRDELKHCSLLAWLLDPHGDHYQGAAFLELFIRQCINSQLAPKPAIDTGDLSCTRVQTEHPIGDGRVDVLIRGKGGTFTLAIEAKIDAGEQEEQLSRYRKSLPKGSVLAFLTVDDREPHSGQADLCIAWSDIATVCRQFIPICQNNFLNELIRQYGNMLQSL